MKEVFLFKNNKELNLGWELEEEIFRGRESIKVIFNESNNYKDALSGEHYSCYSLSGCIDFIYDYFSNFMDERVLYNKKMGFKKIIEKCKLSKTKNEANHYINLLTYFKKYIPEEEIMFYDSRLLKCKKQI